MRQSEDEETAFIVQETLTSFPALQKRRGAQCASSLLWGKTLSEHFSREVRQTRAFAARERDRGCVRPALEAFDDVGEAGAAFRQVGRIDLGDVAQTDDLRAGARA